MAKILKTIKEFGLAVVLALAGWAAHGQVATNFYTFNVNQTVPANSAIGITLSTNLTASMVSISNLLVTVDISGGQNSDLYAYIQGPNGGMAVLVNDLGVMKHNPAGYSDAGVDVTFSDTATNGSIHVYQDVPSYQNDLNASGQLTGVWQPDGENIAPGSAPPKYTGAQTAMLSSFDGTNPDGTWTLFVEEVGGSGAIILNDWNLEIISVPEPSSLALGGLGGLGIFFLVRKRRD